MITRYRNRGTLEVYTCAHLHFLAILVKVETLRHTLYMCICILFACYTDENTQSNSYKCGLTSLL